MSFDGRCSTTFFFLFALLLSYRTRAIFPHRATAVDRLEFNSVSLSLLPWPGCSKLFCAPRVIL